MANIGMHSTISTEISLLQNLEKLDLGDQHFSGTIPSEVGYLTNLCKSEIPFKIMEVSQCNE